MRVTHPFPALKDRIKQQSSGHRCNLISSGPIAVAAAGEEVVDLELRSILLFSFPLFPLPTKRLTFNATSSDDQDSRILHFQASQARTRATFPDPVSSSGSSSARTVASDSTTETDPIRKVGGISARGARNLAGRWRIDIRQ